MSPSRFKIRYKPTWRSLWFRSWRRRGGSTTPHTTPTRWRSRRRRGSCGRGTECTIFFTKSSAENPATRKGIPFMRCCARPTRKRIPSWSRVRRNVQTDVAKFGRASVAAYKPTLCTPNYKPTFRSWRLDRDASVCTAVSVGVAEARQGRPRRGSERGERCAPQEQYNNRNHYYRSSTPATPPKSQRALPLPTPNPHIPSHSHPRKISKMRDLFCKKRRAGGWQTIDRRDPDLLLRPRRFSRIPLTKSKQKELCRRDRPLLRDQGPSSSTAPPSQRALPLPIHNPDIPSHSQPKQISKVRDPFHFLSNIHQKRKTEQKFVPLCVQPERRDEIVAVHELLIVFADLCKPGFQRQLGVFFALLGGRPQRIRVAVGIPVPRPTCAVAEPVGFAILGIDLLVKFIFNKMSIHFLVLNDNYYRIFLHRQRTRTTVFISKLHPTSSRVMY